MEFLRFVIEGDEVDTLLSHAQAPRGYDLIKDFWIWSILSHIVLSSVKKGEIEI